MEAATNACRGLDEDRSRATADYGTVRPVLRQHGGSNPDFYPMTRMAPPAFTLHAASVLLAR